jgi:hypothetical protein
MTPWGPVLQYSPRPCLFWVQPTTVVHLVHGVTCQDKDFPGAKGSAAETPALYPDSPHYSPFCHSCRTHEERLTFWPQTGSKGAAIELRTVSHV